MAGASPPASQKAKITRKYIAGRCGAVLPEQKCVQTRKDPQRILAVLSRGLTQYGRISARQNRVCPCQSMVSFPPILVTRQVFWQAKPCAAWRHRALLIQGAAALRGKGGQSRPPLRALSLRGAQRRGNPFPARRCRADGTSGTPSPTPVIRTPACHSEPVRAAKQVPFG